MLTHNKILIIDDDNFTCNVLSRFLLQQGFTWVETITDPREACAAVRHSKPDLIILDLMMPELSGLELLKLLCDEELLTDASVIMLTAMEDEQARNEALQLGARDFMQKPVTPAAFVAGVLKTLGKDETVCDQSGS